MKHIYFKNQPNHADMMIKVCGMADPDNIASVALLTPMLMGFIFHEASPRCAIGLDPQCVRSLPGYVRPVGVFVDRDEFIDSICSRYGIKIVQLHGSESPELCRRLAARGYVVFKAIPVTAGIDWDQWRAYEDAVTMFVLDSRSPGSGQKFDWSVLDSYSLEVPYMLGGGIGPDDMDVILANMRPGMAGIDINSRFETSPGVKDIRRLVPFIVSLRKFNEYEPSSVAFWEKA